MANERPFPNRLKTLREGMKLTQREVAKFLDYDMTTVCRHESGDRKLPKVAIESYAGLYKVPTVEIFLGPDDVYDDGAAETGSRQG